MKAGIAGMDALPNGRKSIEIGRPGTVMTRTRVEGTKGNGDLVRGLVARRSGEPEVAAPKGRLQNGQRILHRLAGTSARPTLQTVIAEEAKNENEGGLVRHALDHRPSTRLLESAGVLILRPYLPPS